MSDNPLVADLDDVEANKPPTTDISIVDSFTGLATAIESGNWIDSAVAGIGAGLEVASMAIDPFGSLASMGVGWIMEQVEPLKEALDSLAGNPDLVESHAMTWENIANELFAMSEEMAAMVESDVSEWEGEAADNYKEMGEGNAAVLAGVGSTALSLATSTRGAGELVTMVRDFVRDFIAECVGSLVSWLAQVALTAGIGAAWVAPQAAAKITMWVGRIFGWLMGLVTSITALIDLLNG
ncbi:WXG100 family type VII secretion target [Salininema proteolyticum]|uniref:WXG100 family type VII secretion target n=1 Tax=Salininema proteolyticum TaxID=1607685 RepID=A0ABV8U2Q6_9ACTN